MRRKQKKEYDEKIALALREYMLEDHLQKEPSAAFADKGTWLKRPIARANRKMFLRSLGRVAAIFLLVLMAGFGTVCAASSEVRAAVVHTWKQLYERWNGEFEKTEPEEKSPVHYFQTASYTDEKNGWYYAITFTGMPGLHDPVFASFIGIDLRHRYAENCWSEAYQIQIGADGSRIYTINKVRSQGIWFGRGSEAEKRDRKLVQEILKKALDPEISGDPDPADYNFEVLDKELFFDLLKRSLITEPDEWTGKERDVKLSTGFYAEPSWQDGYRFQIITSVKTSGIDEVYIDVLYRIGDAYNAYDQLSDLIEQGKATAEQKEIYTLLQTVRTTIKEQNSFTAMEDELKSINIEGIDFTRLNSFLKDLEEGNGSAYHDDPAILPYETEIISKEEWDEHLRQYGNE